MQAIKEIIGTYEDIPAPDMNTDAKVRRTAKCMHAYHGTHVMHHRYAFMQAGRCSRWLLPVAPE